MVDAELGEGNAGLEEEEARNRSEEARELGIARAVIARETRPKPVEQWLEREIVLLLQGDAFWAEECGSHIPEVDGSSTCTHAGKECASVRG